MIHVEWANKDHSCIIWTFSDDWKWEHFKLAQQTVGVMIGSVEGYVDQILIACPRQHLPPAALSHLRKAFEYIHPRSRLIIIVGSDTLLSLMLNTLMQILQAKILHFAPTKQAAFDLIAAYNDQQKKMANSRIARNQ
ncbi:MAG: hypothetical protein KC546_11260 [Anaerolineae bacterium]|nr:hypothetical protein [Anaerolineae bacterium]MCA9888944.1 hypothetical protein [Anaerolineae bacterium]MCA9895561.1 hypothetical protein [Anaerolineae bacterium]MCB9458175.1 hypothetical protein [Anaerolineaceae bacterium]